MEHDRLVATQRGARISRQRKKLRMRSADVAALMAITPLTYSRWEKSFPQAAFELHAKGLAAVLLLSIEELADGTSDEEEQRAQELISPRAVLADRARSRRLDLQLSLNAVAIPMGISIATLKDWETRLPRNPRIEAEAKWEIQLSAPVGWLRDQNLEAPSIQRSAAQSATPAVKALDVGLANASSEIVAIGYWLSRKPVTRRTCDREGLNASELRVADMFARRYGVCGAEQSVLQAIGDHYSLTRERVRQILDRMLERAAGMPIEANAFKELQRAVHQSPALSVQSFEDKHRHLLGPALSLDDADRFAREVLGCPIATITKMNRPNMAGAPVEMVGSEADMDLVLVVRECAFRLIRAAGSAHLMFTVGMVSERLNRAASISEVRNALSVIEGFDWLTDDEDWFWFGADCGFNRPLDAVRKILAVAGSRVDVEDLHQGICRGRRLVYGEERTRPPALEMPIWVLKGLLQKVVWLKTIQHDDFVLIEDQAIAQILSPSELLVVDFISSRGGVCSRQMLNKEFVVNDQLSAPALAVVLAASPVLQSLGDGMFCVRGRAYSVDSLESARRQFGVKPRDFPVWDEEGRLEFSLRLSQAQLQNAVVDFPAHIVRLLPPGQYAVSGLCEGSMIIGQVPSAPTRVTRLATLLRKSGVLASDHLAFVVDPALRRVSVRLERAPGVL